MPLLSALVFCSVLFCSVVLYSVRCNFPFTVFNGKIKPSVFQQAMVVLMFSHLLSSPAPPSRPHPPRSWTGNVAVSANCNNNCNGLTESESEKLGQSRGWDRLPLTRDNKLGANFTNYNRHLS